MENLFVLCMGCRMEVSNTSVWLGCGAAEPLGRKCPARSGFDHTRRLPLCRCRYDWLSAGVSTSLLGARVNMIGCVPVLSVSVGAGVNKIGVVPVSPRLLGRPCQHGAGVNMFRWVPVST